MKRETVFAKIEKILKELKGQDFEVTGTMSILDELATDSVELMEFVVTAEEEFNITIPDDAIDSFATLHNVVDYIVENKQ
ncbi:phosphopantetheine-binding protein [Streptococcus sp. DD13]|uniref:phosphopantetheine-binding protein n=1 Tax=Streptococcus sp. DD13 TaxID=1777881 RepID=UPI00079C612E|nr:phosphopantetheine-binding protein [Streptococcus sp. DD13]KXT77260.1 Acyl carrier protein [Streptococcus sp. DD13]